MEFSLPKSIEIGGKEYAIRSDYRPCLDICVALSDPNLSIREKAFVAVNILYEDFASIPRNYIQESVDKAMWFINCGKEDNGKKKPTLVNWEQDFNIIVAPINRVAGTEIRALDYLHWWTFISYYYEIGGDCTFAQVVNIRAKIAKNKKMDKADKEWLRDNSDLVYFKNKYSEAEKEFLRQMGGSDA